MGSCRGNCGNDNCGLCRRRVCNYRDCDRGLPSLVDGEYCYKCAERIGVKLELMKLLEKHIENEDVRESAESLIDKLLDE
jgi:hypothetical protein